MGYLVAFYLAIILTDPCPVLYGPYTQEECWAVQEWLVSRGYEKGYCDLLPLPQEAEYLQVGYLP